MADIVLVHGNPETPAIWGPLIEALGRPDVTTLAPPGFGSPVPAGFGATADDYLGWLVGELEGRPEPVDLVGHDWGGGHVVRLAIERPDLIRTWATDIAGCFAPDYVWHDLAQQWQTPDVGEQAVAAMTGAPVADRVTLLVAAGMTPAVAAAVAPAVDEEMGRCILSLYRSARQPAMAELGARLGAAAARPGLAIIPTGDIYTGGEDRARGSAERAGAEVAVLPDRGHWWMLEDPAAGAAVLTAFWSRLS